MGSRRRRSCPQLPDDIWQRIASYLPSRAWVRVSRTCRTMHLVQPPQISLEVRSEADMSWVQKHWGQAQNITLTWPKEDVPCTMAHNAASLTALQALQVAMKDEWNPANPMFMTWVLAKASSLRLLSLKKPTALALPPIQNLRHLIMDSNEFPVTVCTAIRQLRMLQTLRLGVLTQRRGPACAECAELDLTNLTHLSAVALERAVLPLIALPRRCALHLSGSTDTCTLDAWSEARGQGQLKSFNIDSTKTSCSGVPGFMSESGCKYLRWWDLAHVGALARPVKFQAEHFRSLTHLKVKGASVHMYLPQEVPLQVLHVRAVDLSIHCTDASVLGDNLQELKVFFKTMHGFETYTVIGFMAQRGLAVRRQIKRHWLPVEEQDQGIVVSSSAGHWQCPCGACMECLQEKE